MKMNASTKAAPADAYQHLSVGMYKRASRDVREVDVPAVQVIAVDGNEPPGSDQFRGAIAALYGIAYTLKMGLKFSKIQRPDRYFDYGVGALHTLWWSTTGAAFQISAPATLRWKAFLMVPDFITHALFTEAAEQLREKHPETDTSTLHLAVVDEGHCVQALNVGPYDQEQPTIQTLNTYVREHGMEINGAHHEIYISDPNRTAPEKLKTVIRYPVKAA